MENKVAFPTFRDLLHALENSSTSLRVRMSGEGWMPFARLILLSESAMILQDGSDRRVIINLRNVVEFELEESVLNFSANKIYEIAY